VTADDRVHGLRPGRGQRVEAVRSRRDAGAVRPPGHAVVQQRHDPPCALAAQAGGEPDDALWPVAGDRRRVREAMPVGVRQPDRADRSGGGLEQRGGRQPDVEVGAEHRVRQRARAVQQRLHTVVEVVVAGRGGGDRRVGHLAPRAVVE
jgi:hypothetical protein